MKPAELQRLLAAVDALPELAHRIDKAIEGLNGLRREVSQAAGTLEALADTALREALTPLCPHCNTELVLRTARDSGALFLGCPKYPRCKGSVDYRKWRVDAVARLKASTSTGALGGGGSEAPDSREDRGVAEAGVGIESD